jgi:hypothetical protein
MEKPACMPTLMAGAYAGRMPDMTSQAVAHEHGFGATQRRDLWWLGPLATAIGLLAFVIYSTWAAFQGADYESGPYLSPFYSPLIFGASTSEHAWIHLPLGQSHPAWFPLSTALLVLWAPGLFRLTCYYYRKAYYRSIWLDPMACAVGEARTSYLGERYLPLILQNSHRFFAYLAVLFILLLSYDAVRSYIWLDPVTGGHHFGMGVGSLVLTLNPVFLGAYTFGCHSLRHLVGGKKDCFSRSPGGHARFKIWSAVSVLNGHHQLFAWISLFWVGFTDIYVRFIACHGHDMRFF